jgi:hypothetical protein
MHNAAVALPHSDSTTVVDKGCPQLREHVEIHIAFLPFM